MRHNNKSDDACTVQSGVKQLEMAGSWLQRESKDLTSQDDEIAHKGQENIKKKKTCIL